MSTCLSRYLSITYKKCPQYCNNASFKKITFYCFYFSSKEIPMVKSTLLTLLALTLAACGQTQDAPSPPKGNPGGRSRPGKLL